MMLAAILSVTVMAIVAFSIGFVCGKDAGRELAERTAADAAARRQSAFRRAAATNGVVASNGVAIRLGVFGATRRS